MLSLEDLGPIVQPTVVVDTHQKDVSMIYFIRKQVILIVNWVQVLVCRYLSECNDVFGHLDNWANEVIPLCLLQTTCRWTFNRKLSSFNSVALTFWIGLVQYSLVVILYTFVFVLPCRLYLICGYHRHHLNHLLMFETLLSTRKPWSCSYGWKNNKHYIKLR